jgi:transposase, IS5 family
VKVDTQSKLIKTYEVTDASVHDSQVLPSLLNKTDADTELHADSAYRSEKIEDTLQRRGVQARSMRKGAAINR